MSVPPGGAGRASPVPIPPPLRGHPSIRAPEGGKGCCRGRWGAAGVKAGRHRMEPGRQGVESGVLPRRCRPCRRVHCVAAVLPPFAAGHGVAAAERPERRQAERRPTALERPCRPHAQPRASAHRPMRTINRHTRTISRIWQPAGISAERTSGCRREGFLADGCTCALPPRPFSPTRYFPVLFLIIGTNLATLAKIYLAGLIDV
jgi:hypothetical protein